MTRDPHVLEDGTLPTPFSAAELRDGLPDGTVIVLELDGGVRQVSTFSDSDADGATWTVMTPGREEYSERLSWLELQGHAMFPSSSATRRREIIDHPLGTLDCWRYDVGDATDGTVFWFDLTRPGMPVRMIRLVGGERAGGFEAFEWNRGDHEPAGPEN